jgi:hypothetical protein
MGPDPTAPFRAGEPGVIAVTATDAELESLAGRIDFDRMITQRRARLRAAMAYSRAREPLPDHPIAYALGLGHEGVLAGRGAADDRAQTVVDGSVVALRAAVSDATHGFVIEDMVHVGAVPRVLTTLGDGF